MTMRITGFLCLAALAGPAVTARGGEGPSTSTRVYENRLKPIADAASRPILADYPQFVEPVREVARFEAPTLVDDPGPTWRSGPGASPTTPAASSRCRTGSGRTGRP